MIQHGTDSLIDRLAADATPVKRLSPPLVRALVWIAVFVAAGAAAIGLWSDLGEALGRFGNPIVLFESVGPFLTGAAAVVAAFFLSLPDRSRVWIFLPAPPLLFWLAGSGYGCYLQLVEIGPSAWAFGPSLACLQFIVAISIPVSVALFLSLRRSVPLDPIPVLAMGGLGVAGLAAAELQFFHPFDITFLDLGVHVVAVLIVTAVMTLVGRRALAVGQT